MSLRVFDPRGAAALIPIEQQAPEVRMQFWQTVWQLRETFGITREVHSQQRVILESVRLQRMRCEVGRERSRRERIEAKGGIDRAVRPSKTATVRLAIV